MTWQSFRRNAFLLSRCRKCVPIVRRCCCLDFSIWQPESLADSKAVNKPRLRLIASFTSNFALLDEWYVHKLIWYLTLRVPISFSFHMQTALWCVHFQNTGALQIPVVGKCTSNLHHSWRCCLVFQNSHAWRTDCLKLSENYRKAWEWN